jgi:hypothetical protein
VLAHQVGSLAVAREALEGGGLRGRLDVALIDLVLPDGNGTELIRCRLLQACEGGSLTTRWQLFSSPTSR